MPSNYCTDGDGYRVQGDLGRCVFDELLSFRQVEVPNDFQLSALLTINYYLRQNPHFERSYYTKSCKPIFNIITLQQLQLYCTQYCIVRVKLFRFKWRKNVMNTAG